MKRYITWFGIVILMVLAIIIWNITSGSIDVSMGELLDILRGHAADTSDTSYKIIMEIRLPRISAALLLGGALALAGYLLQTFFGNPIAGPYVLGVSSGAKLSVALTMIMLLTKGRSISSLALIASAFVGSLIAMGLVLLLSTRVKSMSILVVCGIMIGYICSAITDLCITFADDSNIVNLHNWSLGSFSGIKWMDVKVMSIIVVICLIATLCIAKPISAYRLGESYAANVGVNIKLLRIELILLSSLLAACVTAFAGPISFVGIAVPHLVKRSVRTTRPLVLIPGCFVLGAVVTLFCDGIARTLFAPTELSISSVTAVLLVPVVIWMMLSKHSEVR